MTDAPPLRANRASRIDYERGLRHAWCYVDRANKRGASWRRRALISFGLFMASVVLNLILIFGR